MEQEWLRLTSQRLDNQATVGHNRAALLVLIEDPHQLAAHTTEHLSGYAVTQGLAA